MAAPTLLNRRLTIEPASTELMTLYPTRAERLNNCACAYCGQLLTPETKLREHVIGRRFVPGVSSMLPGT